MQTRRRYAYFRHRAPPAGGLMLRSIFVLGLMAVGGYYALQSAFNGMLLYLWVAYFRPETWVWWSFIQSLPLSLIVGVYSVLRSPMSDGRFTIDLRSGLLFLFMALVTLSTALSPYASVQASLFQDFIKSIVITYLIASLTIDGSRVRLVIFVIAFSLGFEQAKQGWTTLILHPGSKNDNSVTALGDENEIAVGLLMLTPLLLALSQTATGKWEKRLHQFVGVGVFYRAISTYSRGGFLSAGAMGLVYLLRSKRKVQSAIGMALVAGVVVSVLPQSFWDRMSTIKTNEAEMEDSSASRPHFWRVATLMANDHPLLGVGNFGFQRAFNQYDFLRGRFGRNRSVHSSWFGVLAEVGYPGLLVYVTILLLALIACERVIRRGRKGAIPQDLMYYGIALQTSFAVFLLGGSFVTFQYREILWHFVGLTMALRSVAERAAVTQAPPAPAKPAQATRAFGTGPVEPLWKRA